MLRFIAIRVLQFPLILAIIYLVTFLLVWVAPGDPFTRTDKKIDPAVVAAMKEQWKSYSRPESDLTQIIDTLREPSKLAGLLSVSFLSFTILPAFGGALGAKFLDRR